MNKMYILVLTMGILIILIQFLLAKNHYKLITFFVALLYTIIVMIFILIGTEVLLVFLPISSLILWMLFLLSLRNEKGE